MHVHFLSALLVFAFVAGSVPLSFVHPSVGGVLSPTAEAKSRVRSLLDRVRGNAMPEGIIKTNGRIEAIQVDVAAKYPGRLVDITVEEGSEIKNHQLSWWFDGEPLKAVLKDSATFGMGLWDH